jgi:lipopolysaccharide export LptBFGC system permease protein LptF
LRLDAIDDRPVAHAAPEQMTYQELDRWIADLRACGSNVARYAVALHRRLSFPFVTIIMTLIAIPFAVMTGRRGTLYGVAAGVVLGFSYWFASSVFGALGAAGALTPPVAAWLPNMLFGGGALCLLRAART